MEPGDGCTEYDPVFYSDCEEGWLQESWGGVLVQGARILDIRNKQLLNVTAVVGDALTNAAVVSAGLDAVQSALGMWNLSSDSGKYEPVYDSDDLFAKMQQIFAGLDEDGPKLGVIDQELAMRQLKREHPEAIDALADVVGEAQDDYIDNLQDEWQAGKDAETQQAVDDYEEVQRLLNGEEE
jgi:hypothetical protein